MSAPKNGGCAFPCDSREASQFAGMTLRDWFAGQALAGTIAAVEGSPDYVLRHSEAAHHCYRFADAMLAERRKL